MSKEPVMECPLLKSENSRISTPYCLQEMDYEVELDKLASMVGSLVPKVGGKDREEIIWICEMLYHLSTALRGDFTLTPEECQKIINLGTKYISVVPKDFVLPIAQTGYMAKCHMIRSEFLYLIVLLRKYQQTMDVDNRLFDIYTSLSNYFFGRAVESNVGEYHVFRSRTYK